MLPTLCVLLLQASSGGVQQFGSPDWLVDGVMRDYPLPAALASTQVSRTLVADWNGDLRRDVVLLAGGQVVFQHGPDTFPTNVIVPASAAGSAVLDLEVLPRSDGSVSLLTLVSSGLRVLSWDATTKNFVCQRTYTANGWGTALSIQRIDLDGNALPDYIGISSNARHVLVMKDFDGTSGTPLADIAVGAAILSLAPIDWTGSQPQEVAVRLANELRVYAHTGGTALYSAATTYPTRLLQPVRCYGETDERLAHVDRAANGHDWLGLVSASASATSLDLGNFGIGAAAAADLDNDQDVDLVFCQDTTADLLVLLDDSQTAGHPPFALAGLKVYPGVSTAPLPGNNAQPCLSDFDGDGDVDLLAAMPGGLLRMQRSTVVSETEFWPFLPQEVADTYLHAGPVNGVLDLHMTFLEPEAATAFQPDGLQIVFWRQPDPASPIVEAAPTLNAVFDVAPNYGQWNSPALSLLEPMPFEAVYYLTVREVQRDASGKLLAAGPTATYFYTVDADTYDVLYDGAPTPLKACFLSTGPIGPSQGAITGGGGPSAGPPAPAQ